jgi:TolA-binding protein
MAYGLRNSRLNILLTPLLLSSSILSVCPAAFAKEKSKAEASEQHEQYERDVDEVAFSAQEKAISKLQALLKKYIGTGQEPVLLTKLADFQQQGGAILFRIAHGNASRSKNKDKPLDLTRYNRLMQQSIATYSTLIAKYPHYDEIPRAFYSRGKAYEDLDQKQNATNDYLFLVKNFPNADESASAYMALAEFAIQANDHPKAIAYLKEVEKKPESPHYPFALYKLAWSHYNLKQIPVALSYAERQIRYYTPEESAAQASDKKDLNTVAVTSDSALQENTLLDIPVFFFEGYEQKSSEYSVEKALPYFRKVAKTDAGSEKVLGKMLVRFSKLLRSHDHESDLLNWKNRILSEESNRPESLDVVLVAYEYLLNKRLYKAVVETAQDMVKLYRQGKRFESFASAQKQLLDTAEKLQQLVIKNKNATEVSTYSSILVSLYDAFTQMVEDSDLRIPRVHYNLAETLFAIKDYAGATDHYRWIVEHGQWKKAEQEGAAGVADASLKAIASRYEVLRGKKLIPTELQPRSLQASTPSKLEPQLAQWIEWVNTHEKNRPAQIDNFLFESYRALYSQGYVQEVLDKLTSSVLRHPKSSYAIPSASLILDTHVASEDWEKTRQTANEFMKLSEWKTGDFSKKLLSVASDAAYKQMEALYKAKDYAACLQAVELFLKQYSTSARSADALVLAGSSALAQNNRALAKTYYSRLIDLASAAGKSGDASNLEAALLARGRLAEEEYQFTTAARDYENFLRIAKEPGKIKDGDKLRIKILALTWLGHDLNALRGALENGPKGLCTDAIATDCQKYRALLALENASSAQSEETTLHAFKIAHKGMDDTTKETRAIWAAVALEGSKQLAFRDRNHMLKTLGSGWDELDPLVRFAILPRIVQSVPKAFELNRVAMKDVAPLRADERYITHRVDMIHEMENAATQALKLPWARIRSEVTNQIAGLYIDLARGLGALNPPKNLSESELAAYQDTIRKLVMPFEEKGQDLRAKAFEIASRFAIEDESLARVAEPFFAENPSQSKKLKAMASAGAPPGLSLEFLSKLDPTGSWAGKPRSPASSQLSELSKLKDAPNIGSLWMEAFRGKQWQQLGYFLQQAKEKNIYSKATLSMLKAISLAALGAQGEALSEIDEARSELQPEQWLIVTSSLAQFYSHAYAGEKTESLNKEIRKVQEELAKKKEAGKTAQAQGAGPNS